MGDKVNLVTTYFCFTKSSVMSFLRSPRNGCLTLRAGKESMTRAGGTARMWAGALPTRMERFAARGAAPGGLGMQQRSDGHLAAVAYTGV